MEKAYPDYFVFKDRNSKVDCSDKFSMELRKTQEIATIRLNIQNKVISDNLEMESATIDIIESAFSSIFSSSAVYHYCNESNLEEIRDLTSQAEALFGRHNTKMLTSISIEFLYSRTKGKKVGLHAANQIRSLGFRRAFFAALVRKGSATKS